MKHLSKALFSVISLVLLSSCSSIPPAKIDSKLNAWQGSDINTLIQTWGLPTSEREVNGIKYAEWNSREIKSSPAVNVGLGSFGSHVFGSIGATLFGGNKEIFCKVQIGYNDKGQVILTNWSGDPSACNAAIPDKS